MIADEFTCVLSKELSVFEISEPKGCTFDVKTEFVSVEQSFFVSLKEQTLSFEASMKLSSFLSFIYCLFALFIKSPAFTKRETEWYVENGDTRTLANLQVLQSKLNHPRQ